MDATEVLSRKIYVCDNSTNKNVGEYIEKTDYCKK